MEQGAFPLVVMVEGAAEHEDLLDQHVGQAGEIDILRPSFNNRVAYIIVQQELPLIEASPNHRRVITLENDGGVISGLFVDEAEGAAVPVLGGVVIFLDIVGVDDDIEAGLPRPEEHRLEVIRVNPVVRVEEIDVFPGGGVNPGVSRHGDALIPL